MFTHFPGACLKPLGHLSGISNQFSYIGARAGTSGCCDPDGKEPQAKAYSCTSSAARRRQRGRSSRWWRRGRDSNPRYGFPHADLANLCLKPLGHLSRTFSASLAVRPACGAAQDSGRDHEPPGLQATDSGSLGDGGEGGIRTLETLSRLAVFKTAAINHSATSPRADNLAREPAMQARDRRGRAGPSDQRRGQAAASRARRAADRRAPSASISATERGRPLPEPQNST